MAANALPSIQSPTTTKLSRADLLRASEQAHNDEFRLKRTIDRAARLLDTLEAQAEAIHAEIAELMRPIDALKRSRALKLARAERIEDEILAQMRAARVQKANGFRVELTAKLTPPAVDLYDERAVPAQYYPPPKVPSPDKNAIKRALLCGREVPGARLTQGMTLLRKSQ